MTTALPERRLAVPKKPRSWRSWLITLVVLVVVVFLHAVAVHDTGFSVGRLVHGSKGIWQFLGSAMPPDHSWATIRPALKQCVVTFSMGLLGTTLSIPVALVLALLGSRTTSRNVVVYQVARAIMSFFRAIPSFIWALVFVTAVGLGSFPGTLAILVHNMGVMGKLWSEAMEEADQGPLEALESAGAGPLQRATHVVFPSVLPQFTSLFLYRVDVNVRDALTLGIVGAGGIGFLITNTIQEFEFKTMITYVLMVLVMIIVIDLLSASLRKRLSTAR